MDTTRVDICYRPLRIAWAIHSEDRESFRRAVRLTHTLWGGRFNPIVMADRPEEAKQLVERFRADVIWPVGDAAAVKDLPKQFPHLINPFLPAMLFLPEKDRRTRAHVLDIHNMLVHYQHTPEWKAVDEQGVRTITWAPDDPLADTFLMQHGAYPPAAEIGIDYAEILCQATMAINLCIDKTVPIATEIYDHVSLGYLTRLGVLHRHYSIRPGWDYAGFFVGDAANLDDLVRFWNIRAADIQLHFVDPAHLPRYAAIMPKLGQRLRADLSHLDEHRRKVAVWSRAGKIDDALKIFQGESVSACAIADDDHWIRVLRPPMMIFGEASSLGVFGTENGKMKASFSLSDKPFSSDRWFYTQHLVASVSLFGGDEQQTFHPPYVPELNEFLARTMYFPYNKLRIEPERLGIIIRAADHDSFLYALPVPALVERLFEMAGLRAKLSGGGLITRQLIARLGGVNGARVFKIPGVRRLLKQYGPTQAFTKSAALSLIGGKDQNNPQARFKDHEDLYIEPRKHGSRLTPAMVFTYLVEKGLLRMGAELTCPTCALPSWIALDTLKQSNVCELCGSPFDATRQLVDERLHYRRTGVLGLEKNSQGAIPVALVLQQLDVNLSGIRAMYAPSYDLAPNAGVDLPPCEVDLFWINPDTYPNPAQVILGECKDEGCGIDARDVDNLRRIADALPAHRFETFILFAKLSPFSPDEIALAKTLNGPYRRRVILLTARELEPFYIYDRTQKEMGITSYGRSPDELTDVTAQLYFQAAPTGQDVAAPPAR
jgi:hypothetical protein